MPFFDFLRINRQSKQQKRPRHRTVYLLRVGRGGPADSESTVLVKIADMTAKYGEDYIVRVRGERTKVDNPEGNFSLMEITP